MRIGEHTPDVSPVFRSYQPISVPFPVRASNLTGTLLQVKACASDPSGVNYAQEICACAWSQSYEYSTARSKKVGQALLYYKLLNGWWSFSYPRNGSPSPVCWPNLTVDGAIFEMWMGL